MNNVEEWNFAIRLTRGAGLEPTEELKECIEKEYLYLMWQAPSNGRSYIVGKLIKGDGYEFQYCKEINLAIKNGFCPLICFGNINKSYKSEELFPVFSSRLPHRKRKDIDKILKKYDLKEFDDYELLKRSGAKLPIDHLYFVSS